MFYIRLFVLYTSENIYKRLFVFCGLKNVMQTNFLLHQTDFLENRRLQAIKSSQNSKNQH